MFVMCPATWLEFQKAFFRLENNKDIIGPHYWPFVGGIQRFTLDFLYKGLVMQKAFPIDDFAIACVFVCVFVRKRGTAEIAHSTAEVEIIYG